MVIDPVANTTTTFSVSNTSTQMYKSGVLAPNGKIYAISFFANDYMVIDPVANTTTTFAISTFNGGKYRGGVLAPNGKIYFVPSDVANYMEILTDTTININFPLSRLFNKY